MDERRRYVAIEIWVEDDADSYEIANEFEDHLDSNGYDYFFSHDPIYNEISVLLINEEQTGYIDTILDDRNIRYRYK